MARNDAKSRRLPEGDDGRTIVNMNVEGMPGYTPRETLSDGAERPPQVPLTKREARMFTWGALKAALLVTLVMCLGMVLFVLFCQHVWFR